MQDLAPRSFAVTVYAMFHVSILIMIYETKVRSVLVFGSSFFQTSISEVLLDFLNARTRHIFARPVVFMLKRN